MFHLLTRLKFISLFLFTLVLGGLVGYFLASRNLNQENLDLFYRGSSLNARFTSVILSTLRSGKTDKTLKLLEAELDGELITLSFYEKSVPANRRNKEIYADIAKVREYYRAFPEARPSPYSANALAMTAPLNAP